MSDVLVFLQTAQGTLVSTTAVSTQDGLYAAPGGTTTVATPPVTPVARPTLSFLLAATQAYTQLLFGPGYAGSLVNGSLKLAQRFLLHLLTIKGSIPYRATQGCNFLKYIYGGKTSSESDIFIAFSASMPDVLTNMTAEQLVTDPPNECFAKAQLTQLTLAQNTITATIAVYSQTGDLQNINVPLFFSF